jgi:phage portal protein BeeE
MWPFKSKNQNIDSNIVRAVIRWIGTNTPIWLPDNLETYINKGFLYNPDVYSIVNYKVKKASDIPWVLHEGKR